MTTAITAASDLKAQYDLIVIGAGPAGMSAATEAASHGVSVLLLDENASPGGQIYRAVTRTPVSDRSVLGDDYWKGEKIAEDFLVSSADYAAGATVWSLGNAEAHTPENPLHEIGLSLDGVARIIAGKQVIIATGALERPFPIPGWTLPGVMTGGGAQTVLKSSGLVPDGKTVLAGCGPLLYLFAAQVIAAGGKISALLDTTPSANWSKALPHLPAFLASPYLKKGLKLLWKVRRNIRVVRGVTDIKAEGEGKLSSVTFTKGGRSETLPADLLLLHQGVAPNINLSNAAGCAQDWDEVQLCFVPRTNEWFESSVPGVVIAGDGAGIAGAESAALRGKLAAIGAVFRLGRLDAARRDNAAANVRIDLEIMGRGRAFLDTLYQPAKAFRVPQAAETLVCRCEEVTAGMIRQAVSDGVTGPNQMKSFLRCGMGPCQSRQCGLTLTEMIADERGLPPAQIGGLRLRPPVKPVTLAELAALPKTEAAIKAVVR